ncbi:hypothetical protein TNCV_784201 [Trichonephila clavipes]|nr:hypothetical protein TNCV_784201 [Trichonephila clavipes]
MIDRFRMARAQPLKDITAETVAEAFFSFLGVSLWNSCNSHNRQGAGSLVSRSSKLLANYLVFRKCRTTGYHPQANGMIEELHRPLKSAIKCHATER